jgi:Ca2+-binding EF-hand superfamily protein
MVDEIKSQLKLLFDTYDTNSDGYLSKGEFVAFSHEVLAILERGGSNVVFKERDLNHDDRISFDEFIALMHSPV